MIVVDLETTGLDAQKNSIASIGAVDFLDPSNVFYVECRIEEGAIISEESLKITGFTPESLRDKRRPSVKTVTQDFFWWCKKATARVLSGENPWLDASFLRKSSATYAIEWPFGHRLVDLHSICYAHYLSWGLPIPYERQGDGLGLDQIIEYLGIKADRKLHNALADAKLEAEAFSRIIYGRPLFKEYTQYPIPDAVIQRVERKPSKLPFDPFERERVTQ